MGGWIIQYADQYKVDPFVIASLIYYQSRCSPRRHRKGRHLGLSRLSFLAHRKMIRKGKYHYWVYNNGGWHPKVLQVGRFPFTRRFLLKPEANIYFTAALLSIYSKQCPAIDKAFKSAPHRHAVSHMIYGDRVRGRRSEDLILQTRRRLLQFYTGHSTKPLVQHRGVWFHSPLDGAPRVLSSGFYATRNGGRRRHRAVDFYSDYGEPVRAIADGVVVFAGVQHPRKRGVRLTPRSARRIPRKLMGIGGLFVMIKHKGGFKSGYFHLSRHTVATEATIKAGQIIGYVGLTGIKESDPHLHFELRLHNRRINPAPYLRPYLVPAIKRHRRPSS
jgi:hypothetical protein